MKNNFLNCSVFVYYLKSWSMKKNSIKEKIIIISKKVFFFSLDKKKFLEVIKKLKIYYYLLIISNLILNLLIIIYIHIINISKFRTIIIFGCIYIY